MWEEFDEQDSDVPQGWDEDAPRGGLFRDMPWGIFDWNQKEWYQDFTEEWDDNQWRWEFLRRREDYREAFEKALENLENPLLAPPDADPDTFQRFVNQDFPTGEEDEETFWQSVKQNWSISLWQDGMRAFPFAHMGAEKFGLEEFFDPVISNWGGIGPEWGSGLVYGGFDETEYRLTEKGKFEEVNADYMRAYTFDLRRPLKPQIEELKKELHNEQYWYFAYGGGAPEGKELDEIERLYGGGEHLGVQLDARELWALSAVKQPKMHRAIWGDYLRVLDAREAGASLNQIADILPDHIGRRDAKAAHNFWEQARAQQFRI